jgi:hypothetical protein
MPGVGGSEPWSLGWRSGRSQAAEYAMEQARRLKEKAENPDEVTVTAVTIGSEKAVDAVRKALQTGADAGVHVSDEAIAGSDAIATSLMLAAAAKKAAGGGVPDLVMCGMASTDGSMGVLPAMLAERRGVLQVTLASVVETQGAQVRIKRDGDVATEVVGATMPLETYSLATRSQVSALQHPEGPMTHARGCVRGRRESGSSDAGRQPRDPVHPHDLAFRRTALGHVGRPAEVPFAPGVGGRPWCMGRMGVGKGRIDTLIRRTVWARRPAVLCQTFDG